MGFSCIIHDITGAQKNRRRTFSHGKAGVSRTVGRGIAHDFNNILTVILGNISLARLWIDSSDAPYTLLIEAERLVNGLEI